MGPDVAFDVKVSKAGQEGIDGVIHDTRPIVGQKIVFQAKNYTSNHDQLAIVKAFATTVKEQKAHKDIAPTVGSKRQRGAQDQDSAGAKTRRTMRRA